MKVEARGIVYDAAQRPDSEKIAFFTSLCPLANGDMLCGFQVGPAKQAPTGSIRLCRSKDGGNTWKEVPFRFETRFQGVPGSLSTAEMVEVEPGRLLLLTSWFDRSDPKKPLFDPVTEGVLPGKQLKTFSSDNGETWDRWEEVPTPGLRGCATCGSPVKWSDGTIGFVFESYKEYGDTTGHHAAWMLLSRDGGRSFPEKFLVAMDPAHQVYYWDQRVCRGHKARDFIALFWTHDLKQKKDLTVHQRSGSLDEDPSSGGPVTDIKIPGQIAAPLLLDDGRIFGFVVDRGRPGTMTLWQSRDGGATWPKEDVLVVHVHDERAAVSQGKENIDFKQYWEDMGKWSFGHPAIRSLGKGRVLVAHYAGSPERMSIHWARINTD